MKIETSGWSRLLLLAVLFTQVGFCWQARTRSLRGDVDLRVFYTAGVMMRTGHATDLYRYSALQQTQGELFHGGQALPFLYPAAAALPFAPLSRLPYRAAFCLLLAMNLSLIWIAARLLFTAQLAAKAALLFAACFPVSIALMQGQISFILLVVYAGFATLLHRQRPIAAGVCLALAMIKFQVALPVALLYLIWKQYRVILGFTLGTAALAVISIAVTGVHGAIEYLTSLAGVGTSVLLDPAAAKMHFGMLATDMPNLHGLLAGLTSSHTALGLFTLALSVIIMIWSGVQKPSLAVALPAAMLVSYHLQAYDLTLLLVPLSLLQKPSRWIFASIAMLTIPIAPWLLIHHETRWLALSVLFAWIAGCLTGSTRAQAAEWITHRAEEQRA